MLSSCFYRFFSTTATPSSLLILLDQHLLPTSGLQIWKIMILQLPLRKPGLGQKNLYSFLLCLYFIYLGRVFRSRELPILLPPPSHPSWELVLLLCFQLECLRVRSGALGYTRYTCESSGHRLCFPKSHCSQQVWASLSRWPCRCLVKLHFRHPPPQGYTLQFLCGLRHIFFYC